MSPVPLLDLQAQYASIRGRAREAMDRVAESQVFILGPEVEAFEREAAAYCGCKHAIGCSSGTDALIMALMAAGVAPGDEVITTAYSFFATAGSIVRLGARPVFVDVDPVSFNLRVSGIEPLITEKTRAVMPVHLFGQCAEMAPLLDLAKRHRLTVIEDAAQAIGSETNGRRAGSFGDMGCFSFYPTKNLGAFGDAGMVTTNDDALAGHLRKLRVHGGVKRYHNEIIGGNFRLDAIQAAVLRVKLEYLDRWTEARQRNAARYCRLFQESGAALSPDDFDRRLKAADAGEVWALEGRERVLLPAESPGAGRAAVRSGAAPFPAHRHIYNQYVIRTGHRDSVIASLKKAEIGHMIYYPLPLPLLECFADLGYHAGDFPVSEAASQTSLALPVYPELTEEQQREVVHAVVRGLTGG